MTRAVLLMGPTATGKTDLALRLVQDLPIEIISVDSALIYKDMNIGTAKPSIQELQSVPHHLIDIVDPLSSYSVADFIDDSVRLIHDISKRGKLPILVGGTMMYYNALLNGLSILPQANQKIREQIEHEATISSWQSLYDKLLQIDPIAAEKIKPNDKQRISRALEVYYLTGKPISVLQKESNVRKSEGISFLPLGIIPDNREILHERIAIRFRKMLDSGFIEEVKNLRIKYPELTINHTSMRCVGYYQVWQYLDGLINLDQLYEMGVAATRQLAKRQITWLRGMDVVNLDKDNLNFDTLYKNLIHSISKDWLN